MYRYLIDINESGNVITADFPKCIYIMNITLRSSESNLLKYN